MSGIPEDIFATARTLADDAVTYGYTQAVLDIAKALHAERERCKQAALATGNFGDYRREELTADYGQPRFDMMNDIIAAIDAAHAAIPGSFYPKSGTVYTIREIRDDSPLTRGREQIVVLLSEVDNGHMIGSMPVPGKRCFVEPGFNPNGFRPVQKRTTSIAIFTALLNPSPADRADIELEEFVLQHSTPMQDQVR